MADEYIRKDFKWRPPAHAGVGITNVATSLTLSRRHGLANRDAGEVRGRD